MALSAFSDKSNRFRPADLDKTPGRVMAHRHGLIPHIEATSIPSGTDLDLRRCELGMVAAAETEEAHHPVYDTLQRSPPAGFVPGEDAVRATHDGAQPDSILATIDGARKYAEGSAVRIEIRNRTNLGIAKKLAAIKMAN